MFESRTPESTQPRGTQAAWQAVCSWGQTYGALMALLSLTVLKDSCYRYAQKGSLPPSPMLGARMAKLMESFLF